MQVEARFGPPARPGALGPAGQFTVVLVVIGIAVFGLSRIKRPEAPAAISPGGLLPIGQVSDRFLSYNIEMVEVTGGRFWRPYDGSGARKGNDRFAYRPPIDLNNRRLQALAHALGPAYVRFSGTWANATFFSDQDTAPEKPPAGFDAVLTKDQWKSAL